MHNQINRFTDPPSAALKQKLAGIKLAFQQRLGEFAEIIITYN